jgi:hypothetical protein
MYQGNVNVLKRVDKGANDAVMFHAKCLGKVGHKLRKISGFGTSASCAKFLKNQDPF